VTSLRLSGASNIEMQLRLLTEWLSSWGKRETEWPDNPSPSQMKLNELRKIRIESMPSLIASRASYNTLLASEMSASVQDCWWKNPRCSDIPDRQPTRRRQRLAIATSRGFADADRQSAPFACANTSFPGSVNGPASIVDRSLTASR
jgi:hypothetical protein